jgi:hypothetical protein
VSTNALLTPKSPVRVPPVERSGERPHARAGARRITGPADLVFGPTLACREFAVRFSSTGPRPLLPFTGAGLTPKPHHAQQPLVALRGSFRLRLASTFNHRPEPVRMIAICRHVQMLVRRWCRKQAPGKEGAGRIQSSLSEKMRPISFLATSSPVTL